MHRYVNQTSGDRGVTQRCVAFLKATRHSKPLSFFLRRSSEWLQSWAALHQVGFSCYLTMSDTDVISVSGLLPLGSFSLSASSELWKLIIDLKRILGFITLTVKMPKWSVHLLGRDWSLSTRPGPGPELSETWSPTSVELPPEFSEIKSGSSLWKVSASRPGPGLIQTVTV